MRFQNSCATLLVFSFLLLLSLSCKKELPVEKELLYRQEGQLLKDSVYHYYHLYSLWSSSVLPDNKAVFAFTDNHNSTLDVLDAMKRTTPFYAGYQTNIDRFSYLTDLDGIDNHAADQENQHQGFGIFASIGSVNAQKAYPVIYFVAAGSPAAQAGIKRSDIILGIDEYQDFGIPVTCNTSGCQASNEKMQQAVTNRLLDAMKQTRMQMKLRHADQTESVVTIIALAYEIDPIIKNKVFVYPSKSVGYLALSSFEDVSGTNLNRQKLDQVFSNFEQQHIDDLIFDLRYNSGGYVSTAAYIANKVAGTAAHNALMYTYILNDYLSGQTDLRDKQFSDVHFRLNGNLNINTVYFLVTDITASASELLINVLKPYMNVIVIAEHKGTYGKPVGFFKQEIMGKVALWVASFKLANSRAETDYWGGIEADQKNVTDYIFKDFGDEEENMVAAALQSAVGKTSPSRMAGRTVNTLHVQNTKMSNVNTIPSIGMRQ